MRVVIQRVSRASVAVNGSIQSQIRKGILVFLGIEDRDEYADADCLAAKVTKLRIFDDEDGVMNRSVLDLQGEILVVSQFTLMASTRKGNRPSYIKASKPEKAVPLYEYFCAACERMLEKPVAQGVFGADMRIELINEGPVTIIIDTHEREP